MLTNIKIYTILVLEWLVVVLLLNITLLPLGWAFPVGALIFFGGIVLYQILRQKYRKMRISKIYKTLPSKPKFIEHEEGFKYRDLNKNGKLDIYEDPRQPVELRVNDLLSQMNVKEKAGLLFNHFTFIKDPEKLMCFSDYIYDTYPEEMLFLKNMNTFTIFGGNNSPVHTAKITNKLQELASRTRLGIPVTIASDPRHHYDAGVGAGAAQLGISRWPEQLGLAASRDTEMVEKFGEISCKEYRAQGIHLILGPMADTATSPMWGRNYGTFGENYELVSKMTKSLINGMQSNQLTEKSVACQVKHFPGGGPQKDGWDSHFPYGKEQIYPSKKFDEHLKPFEAAIKTGVAQVMPYYSIPKGIDGVEEIGFNFNKAIITDLLRNKLKFSGVIGTDFSVVKGTKVLGFNLLFPKVWGVEKLSPKQRLKKAFEAGVDQIGGDTCVNLLVKLLEEEKLSIKNIDESCRRVLRDKFKLGLFDNPFVDESKVEDVCGKEVFMKAGVRAQEKSLVLLKNGKEKPILPLKEGIKVYSENISVEGLSKYAEIVDTPEEADVAIIKRDSPSIKQYRYAYEKLFKQGRLDFCDKEKNEILNVMKKVPTILYLGLDRPVVIPELNEACEAFIGHFGCEEEVYLKLIFGKFSPTGKLPYSLPKNMEVVYHHKVDKPLDKDDALYEYGYGLTY